jgi:hypothetical protein
MEPILLSRICNRNIPVHIWGLPGKDEILHSFYLVKNILRQLGSGVHAGHSCSTRREQPDVLAFRLSHCNKHRAYVNGLPRYAQTVISIQFDSCLATFSLWEDGRAVQKKWLHVDH